MDPSQSFHDTDPDHASRYGKATMQPQQTQQVQQMQQMPSPHSQQQPGYIQWAAQPITAYQLVPMDYQHVYTHQHPTVFAFPPNMGMPPMTPVTPMSPTNGQYVASGDGSFSPIHRQISLTFQQASPIQGGYYNPSPPQYQYQSTPCQPQQPIQQQQYQQVSAAMPMMPSHTVNGSPEVPRTSQSFAPSMAFVTPPPVPTRQQEKLDTFVDSPVASVPATLPRLAPRQTSMMLRRLNKPQPLALSTSHLRRTQQEEGYSGSPKAPRSSSMPVGRKPIGGGAIPPSVTSVSSDREYDGGDSSYSTSPLASEANAKIRRRMRTIPLAPRMSRHLRTTSPAVDNTVEEPPSPTPRHSKMSFREHVSAKKEEGSLEQFLQDHIYAIESNYTNENDENADDSTIARAGSARPGLSSSDEWYTTTDSNPVHSRHRHRVSGVRVDQDESGSGSGGFCNCGMQQCFGCGLFISRPETHTCMGVVSENDN
ncbi:hypothetical protein SEUCBS139899_006435 [Sporothrix eucalyptigena]